VWEVEAPPRFLRVELVAGDGDSRAQRWHDHLAAVAAGGAEVRAPLRELEEAWRRPWIRCLSNPIYAAPKQTGRGGNGRDGRRATGRA
jgi:hypothetical protein